MAHFLSMDAAARESHELALLLDGRCRRCAEPIPGGTALGGRPCPFCAEQTLPTAEERGALSELFAARAGARLWVALVVLAAATLLTGWLPLVASLLLAGGLVWIRATIVGPTTRLFGAPRRVVSRWTLRLTAAVFVGLSLIVLELLTLVPVAGAAAKLVLVPSQVAFAGWFARSYLAWQARQESAGRPVAAWEWVVLATGLLVIALVMMVVVKLILWLAALFHAIGGAL
jgi:hypothetical protein